MFAGSAFKFSPSTSSSRASDTVIVAVAGSSTTAPFSKLIRDGTAPDVRSHPVSVPVTAPAAVATCRSTVVVRYGGRKAGLVVDSLLGEFQTVIKPLGKVFAGARFLSGSSILGNGDVALILDMAALLAGVENESQAEAA